MNSEVVVLVLVGDVEVIGTVYRAEDADMLDENCIVLDDPLQIFMMPNGESMTVGMAPYKPYLSYPLAFHKNNVVSVCSPTPQLRDSYLKQQSSLRAMKSGILLPPGTRV